LRLLGFDITRARAEKTLSSVPSGRGGWWGVVRESFAGAWQQNVEVVTADVMVYPAVFACMTLIASDIAKLRPKLVMVGTDGIWQETTSPAFSPVLRKPGAVQNRIQFFESWVLSKLSRGNTYILKGRDNRGVVNSLHVLDPGLVTVLVSSDTGEVFYRLNTDNLAGVEAQVTVPASEIIHDRFNCLYHPLVGMSPIAACGLTATQGLKIQSNSASFFENSSMPPGILTAPGAIANETAERLKAHWEENYTGDNAKKVAVLGDGLKFERMSMSAVDSQLIEQLKWTAEVICSAFHVPPYKIGIGQMPTYNNVQALNVEYYSQALQILIESIELCLDEGLGLAASGPQEMGVEFDLDGLLRMDSVTQMSVLKEAVSAAVMAPNEARRKVDLRPVKGGESPMIQEQNYSLSAIAKRDAKPDPWAKEPAAPAAAPANENDDLSDEDMTLAIGFALQKALRQSTAPLMIADMR
jgi:HK97 family phage portal protein